MLFGKHLCLWHRAVSVLLLALCLAVLAGCAPAGQASADELQEAAAGANANRGERPNIVLIVADDLGYGDIEPYGQRHIRTPHLDRMAREGTRFRQFYAGSTVCAPSRSVLMTGQHTGRTPIRGNRPVYPIGQEPLPPASVTVAEVLAGAGYRTGLFGKWGLGGPQSESKPSDQGFGTFFGYIGQRRAHYYWPEFLFASSPSEPLHRVTLEGNEVNDDPDRYPGAGPAVQRGTYGPAAILERALAFIEEGADEGTRSGQPFFAYVPTAIPHRQLEAPQSAMQPYLTEPGESIFPETPASGPIYGDQAMPNATYAAMVSHLDAAVGRIFEKLRETGQAENTIVLFTSDNGPTGTQNVDLALFDSNGPLRGAKRDLYEGGIRVPLLAWGPGVPSGETSYHVGYLGDLMATFAEWAGAEPPEPNDSVSMAPALAGREEAQPQHDYLYWEFYRDGTKQAVRRGRWKAIRSPMGAQGQTALYNLERDLSERRDVAAAHPTVVRELEALMEEAHTPSPLWDAASSEE